MAAPIRGLREGRQGQAARQGNGVSRIGEGMSDPIVICLIVCATLVALSLIGRRR